MFSITTKVKLAAGIAAGALTLGAAGAYTAQNLPQTVPPAKIVTIGAPNTPQITVAALGTAPKLTLPTTPFSDPGACVSFFATNRNYALVPKGYVTGMSATISKANYHGKLMSGINAWCKAQIKASSTTTTTTTVQTVTTDTTQANDSQSGPPLGHGHGHGHGKPAFATD